MSSATGSLVVTAAHCIWDATEKRQALNTLFVPADADDSLHQPYGAWSAVEVIYPEVFAEEADYEDSISGRGWSYDFAFLVMEEQNGQTIQEVTGAMGIAFGVPNQSLVSTGYPTLEPYDGRNRYYCSTTSYQIGYFGGYLWQCDMTSGISGGGVFAFYNRDTDVGYVVAVNSLGYYDSDGNKTRIESGVLGEVALSLYTAAGGYGEPD